MCIGFLVGFLPHTIEELDCNTLHCNGGFGVEPPICFLGISVLLQRIHSLGKDHRMWWISVRKRNRGNQQMTWGISVLWTRWLTDKPSLLVHERSCVARFLGMIPPLLLMFNWSWQHIGYTSAPGMFFIHSTGRTIM